MTNLQNIQMLHFKLLPLKHQFYGYEMKVHFKLEYHKHLKLFVFQFKK